MGLDFVPSGGADIDAAAYRECARGLLHEADPDAPALGVEIAVPVASVNADTSTHAARVNITAGRVDVHAARDSGNLDGSELAAQVHAAGYCPDRDVDANRAANAYAL